MTASATLYLWHTSFFTKMIGGGHAGLDIVNGGSTRYVTWLPSLASGSGPCRGGGEANQRLGFEFVRNRHSGQVERNQQHAFNARATNPYAQGPHTLADETDIFHAHDFEADIPAHDTVGGAVWGLNVDAIERWWLEILRLPPGHPRREFVTLSFAQDTEASSGRNCCSTVTEALLVGGLERFHSAPSNVLYQGSSSLKRWVEKAVARIATLNQQRAALIASAEYQHAQAFPGAPQADLDGVDDLPELGAWKNASRVESGLRTGIARRKEQVAEIDRLLPLYHASRGRVNQRDILPHQPGDPQERWLVLLGDIQTQCYDHLVQKRGSDRRAAMVSLARSVMNVLDGYVRHQRNLRAALNGPISTISSQSLREQQEAEFSTSCPWHERTGDYGRRR